MTDVKVKEKPLRMGRSSGTLVCVYRLTQKKAHGYVHTYVIINFTDPKDV